ncbi:MAG: sulfonate transport system permease protein [Rhodobacteraceae bacterium HLUCCA24]|nr:MAG: sulfonate transport system permease protein [Rhodobacteraceae bacterium HLUCCA24]
MNRAGTLDPARQKPRGAPPHTGRLGGSWTGVLLIAALLMLWEVSARYWVDSTSWPPVSAVGLAIVAGSGELLVVFAQSIRLMLTGFVTGAILGIAVGLAIGLSRFLRLALSPTLEFLRPLPVPGLVPPLILLLGIDDAMKITVIALSTFFPVLINTAQGVRSLDPTLLDTARTFRHGRARTLISVILPASMPYVLAGLRISLALALIVTVVAEMIAGGSGIGYYILTMQYAMNPAEMYAAIVLLAVTGYLLNLGILAIETRVLHWYRASGD